MAHTAIRVNQAIERGLSLLGTPYSQQQRGTYMNAPFYDCSSFIGTIWGIYSCPATPSMVKVYTDAGFDHYDYGSVSLKKGDILVYNGPHGGAGDDGHTCMIYTDGLGILESTGSVGVRTTGFYDYGWQHILRGSGGIYIIKWTGEGAFG